MTILTDELHCEGPSEEEFDTDSLFGSNNPNLERSLTHIPGAATVSPIAQRSAASIPGLFFDPSTLISPTLANELSEVVAEYFGGDSRPGRVNQIMFFGRATEASSGLPSFLDKLVIALCVLLKPHLPKHIHQLLFPSVSSASRQAILNHYMPGEGITPHVDLLTRFADGIVAVSLGSGTVMTFRRVEDGQMNDVRKRIDIYLPERSVLVLTGEARYKWSHGIEERLEDCIENEKEGIWVQRGSRTSITLRWLLPGADIVGNMD